MSKSHFSRVPHAMTMPHRQRHSRETNNRQTKSHPSHAIVDPSINNLPSTWNSRSCCNSCETVVWAMYQMDSRPIAAEIWNNLLQHQSIFLLTACRHVWRVVCWHEMRFQENLIWHWFRKKSRTCDEDDDYTTSGTIWSSKIKRKKRKRLGMGWGLVLLLGARSACADEKREEGIF